MNDQAIMDILDRLRNRFYGKYRGTVTQVDAPTMRIKAKIPSVLAGQESGWCVACVPYAGKQVGFAFLPEVGTGVWIEFEGGDVSYPIWTGCYWRKDEPPDDAAAAAVEIADIAVGHLRSNRLLRVLSPEEMHTALRQAATAPNIAPKLAT